MKVLNFTIAHLVFKATSSEKKVFAEKAISRDFQYNQPWHVGFKG